jgi:hypothetical protein
MNPGSLTGGDIRRGSATLRRLLVEDVLGSAWRHHGFQREPAIYGPHAEKLAALRSRRLEHAVSLIVGGGRLNNVDVAMIGAFRVFNPQTGKGPEDDEGFGVEVSTIARKASGQTATSDLSALVEHPWHLKAYLQAPGAVRRGERISRREVIKHFANDIGGVHLDRAKKDAPDQTRELVREMEQRVMADTMDGIYFEVLSIGQAIGRSPDVKALEEAIKAAGDGRPEGAAPA